MQNREEFDGDSGNICSSASAACRTTGSYAGSNRAGYRRPAIHTGMVTCEVEETLDFGELLGRKFWKYKLHFSHFLNRNPTLFQAVGGMDAIVAPSRSASAIWCYTGASLSRAIARATGSGSCIVDRTALSGLPGQLMPSARFPPRC